MIGVVRLLRFIERCPADALVGLRNLIDRELERRDVCEHGVRTGEWCEECNREYKRARKENGDD